MREAPSTSATADQRHGTECTERNGPGSASDALRAMVEGTIENNPHRERRDIVRGWFAGTR
jgi:hypothetical protein